MLKKIKKTAEPPAPQAPAPPMPQTPGNTYVSPEEAMKSFHPLPPPDLEALKKDFQAKSNAAQKEHGKELVGDKEERPEVQ
jgi:hypothetical protein